jgi:membrane-bound serine protease (ClpP class)
VDPGPGTLWVVRIEDDMVNVGSADYVLSALSRAQRDPSARALLLVLDTPGGSLDDTRRMVKEFLPSPLPVLVHVGPAGARAGSAGVFLTMASHWATMAPATNIGAAHPVFMAPGGGEDEKSDAAKDQAAILLEKVTNDTVAWARNIATVRGRNADWVEKAVRDSVSIGVGEAVALDVVDAEAPDLDAALATADGRSVHLLDGRSVVLRTLGPRTEVEPTTRQRALLFIADPNIAYLLLAVGVLLLWIEVKQPGLTLPGVGGVLCLLLAALGMSLLPVNLVAVLLVIGGVGLLIAEIYLPTFGALAVLGVVALAAGGVFLVDRSLEFDVGVDTGVIGALVTGCVLVSVATGALVLRVQRRPARGGRDGMVGALGTVVEAIPGGSGEGIVLVHSERWKARSGAAIAPGRAVIVRSLAGLVVSVDATGREGEGP